MTRALDPYNGGIVGYVFHDNDTNPNVNIVVHMDASQDDGAHPNGNVITNNGHATTLHANGQTVVDDAVAADDCTSIDDGGVTVDGADQTAICGESLIDLIFGRNTLSKRPAFPMRI